MAYGNSRRDEQKSQLGSPEETNRVSVSNKAASFSPGTQMGEMTNNATMNAIGAVSKFGTKLANAYVQKEKAAAKLEGEAAFIAGKTLEEIEVSGDRHSIDAFRALNAKSEAANLTQEALDFVKDKGYELDSDELTAELSTRYSKMIDGLSPAVGGMVHDAYVAKLPNVIQTHSQLNTAYKLNENKVALQSNLLSAFGEGALDNEQIDAVLNDFEEFGSVFSKDDQKSIMAEVINTSLLEGNVDLYYSITGHKAYKELNVNVRQQLNNNFRAHQNKALKDMSAEASAELASIKSRRSSTPLSGYSDEQYYEDLEKFYRDEELIFEGTLQGQAISDVVLRRDLDDKQLTATFKRNLVTGNYLSTAHILVNDANVLIPGKTNSESIETIESLYMGIGPDGSKLNIEVSSDKDNTTAVIIAALDGVDAANAWIAEGSNPQGEAYNKAVSLWNEDKGPQSRTQEESLKVVDEVLEERATARKEKADANFQITKTRVDYALKHDGMTNEEASTILAQAAQADWLENTPQALLEGVQLLTADANDKNLARYRQQESRANAEVTKAINNWEQQIENATRDGYLYSADEFDAMEASLNSKVFNILSSYGVPTEFINKYQHSSRVANSKNTRKRANDIKAFNIKSGIDEMRSKGAVTTGTFNADFTQAFENQLDINKPMDANILDFGGVPAEYDKSAELNNFLGGTDTTANADVLKSLKDFIVADFNPLTTKSAGLMFKDDNARLTAIRLADNLRSQFGEDINNMPLEAISEGITAIKASDLSTRFMDSKARDMLPEDRLGAVVNKVGTDTLTDMNIGKAFNEAGTQGFMAEMGRLLNDNRPADVIWNRDTYTDPETGETVNRIGSKVSTKHRSLVRKQIKDSNSPLSNYLNGPLMANAKAYFDARGGKVSVAQMEKYLSDQVSKNTLIVGSDVIVNPTATGESFHSQIHQGRNVTTKASDNTYIHGYIGSLAYAGDTIPVLDSEGNQAVDAQGKALTKPNQFSALLDKKKLTVVNQFLNNFSETFNDTTQSQTDMSFSQMGMRPLVLQPSFNGKGLNVYTVPVGIDDVNNPDNLINLGTVSFKDIGNYGYNNIEKRQAD